MMTRRRVAVLLIAAFASLTLSSVATRLSAASFPASLSDREFWSLTETLSEPNGSFRSDNFLSNERGYQLVIPDLLERITPGAGVYLGVGPEQNFPYIVALRPKAAFIIDIRRGNLDEHLMYKALFELSANRAEFLSRLFSRKRPAGLSDDATIAELFNAFEKVAPSEDLYTENLKAMVDLLKKKHRFPLSDDDVSGITYVYRDAFFIGGPSLDYSFGRARGGGFAAPTYRELMLADDGFGRNRGYLASEENFQYLRNLERKNLLVPVVGNFGGPKAIRAVGKYVKDHGATVVAFYLSNVEQYLAQDGIWGTFCSNVAALPLDDSSTFIYSGRGGPNALVRSRPNQFVGGGGGGLQTTIRPIRRDLLLCSSVQTPPDAVR